VAVSPFVGGRALKGPTEDFCRQAGLPLGTNCAIEAYAGLVHGVVADEPGEGAPVCVTNTLLTTPEERRRLAEDTLEFARKVPKRR
jgi:LPPG:FO 2-phospho-L-lactate transferase